MITKGILAERLAVSVRTIDRWMQEGRIPFIKLPGKDASTGSVRFDYEAVLDSLKVYNDKQDAK